MVADINAKYCPSSGIADRHRNGQKIVIDYEECVGMSLEERLGVWLSGEAGEGESRVWAGQRGRDGSITMVRMARNKFKRTVRRKRRERWSRGQLEAARIKARAIGK